jgi:hypothetical protein
LRGAATYHADRPHAKDGPPPMQVILDFINNLLQLLRILF